ncbi:MAG: M50 family metallopeptidase [Acidobacteria bacterium]|nr:M50 family metallopeptidase [Acidobacteriota bacterium]MBK9705643.1 M50 family metallopeptidase [Acidobacteriota bacterium]
MAKQVQTNGRESVWLLVLAAALTMLIYYIPMGFFAVYPLRLFVTFIHEGGHALMALLTAGSVEKLVIYADASGETYTRGGSQFLIASAGYLASTVYGASLLVLCSDGKKAKAVLTATALLIVALTGFFAKDLFSIFIGISLALILVFVVLSFGARLAHFSLSFLAVQCCLNALYDLRTLFVVSASTSMRSDAKTLEELTMVPAVLWASMLIVVSTITLLIAVSIHNARSRLA